MTRHLSAFTAVSLLCASQLPCAAWADPLSPSANAEHYALWQSGSETGCLLTLEPVEGIETGGRFLVRPSGNCAEVEAYFADAANASREIDGSLTISSPDGVTLMVLAPGDGFDYEAVQPREAMVALAAAN